MELIEDWNKFRTIHLLTLEGVFQMILNNKSLECRRIKENVASEIFKMTKKQLSQNRVKKQETESDIK